jgi:hypothetical protein
MSLFISSVFTYDEDAGNYIQAVETADAQALEPATRKAINNFVIGCKADGTWDAIKASCILAGARTLAGALVPLVGTAPTNNGFIGIGTDYVRKTGLLGDGTTKYLDSNRNNNADPQNSQHLAIWASTAGQIQSLYISASQGTAGTGASGFGIWVGNYLFFRSRKSSSFARPNGTGSSTGLIGVSRGSSSSYFARHGQNTVSVSFSSETPRNANVMVFAEDGSTLYRSNARLAFYSIGESLDLAQLDARVTDLINAFAVTIP